MLATQRTSSFRLSGSQPKVDQHLDRLSLVEINSPHRKSSIVEIEPAAGLLSQKLALELELRKSEQLNKCIHSEPYLSTFKGKPGRSRASGSNQTAGQRSLESLDSRCSSSSNIENHNLNNQDSNNNISSSLCSATSLKTHAGGCPLDSASVLLESVASLRQPLDASQLQVNLKPKAADGSPKGIDGLELADIESPSIRQPGDSKCGGGPSNGASKWFCWPGQRNGGPPFKFVGILSSLLASWMFGMSLVCVKLLPDPSVQGRAVAMSLRGIVMMVICSVTILYQGSSFLVRRDELLVNVLRCFFGTTGVFMTYCALKYLSLGDAMAIIFSSPIWTSILSWLILKEALQWPHLVAMPISFLGIILIAHPALIGLDPEVFPLASLFGATSEWAQVGGDNLNQKMASMRLSLPGPADIEIPELTMNATTVQASELSNETINSGDDDRWIGVIIALLTSFVVSAVHIVLKFRKKTPIQTTVFWFSFTMMAAGFILMAFNGIGQLPSTAFEYLLYFGNGFFSWLGQVLMQYAFLHEKANVLSIVKTCDVATSFIVSAIFLEDEIYWTSVMGAMIIGLVVALIMASNVLLDKYTRMRADRLARYQDKDPKILKNGPKDSHRVDVKA